jgi:hypothetical protein
VIGNGFPASVTQNKKGFEMKKRFIVGFALLVIVSSLMLPNQVVSANVSVTHPTLTSTVTGGCGCERFWTAGGITHLRNCVVYMSYTSSEDSRLEGTTTLTLSRNVFSDENDYPARDHGTWVLDAENVDGGYWKGTFTANMDDSGYMTVKIRGKGYGTLNGLLFESTAHGMGGAGTVTITELPSYDGPGP